MHRILDPFTQGEQNGASSQGGLGVRLALVMGFVEVYGGTVSATTEGPAPGAEFAVRLRLLERVLAEERSGSNPIVCITRIVGA